MWFTIRKTFNPDQLRGPDGKFIPSAEAKQILADPDAKKFAELGYHVDPKTGIWTNPATGFKYVTHLTGENWEKLPLHQTYPLAASQGYVKDADHQWVKNPNAVLLTESSKQGLLANGFKEDEHGAWTHPDRPGVKLTWNPHENKWDWSGTQQKSWSEVIKPILSGEKQPDPTNSQGYLNSMAANKGWQHQGGGIWLNPQTGAKIVGNDTSQKWPHLEPGNHPMAEKNGWIKNSSGVWVKPPKDWGVMSLGTVSAVNEYESKPHAETSHEEPKSEQPSKPGKTVYPKDTIVSHEESKKWPKLDMTKPHPLAQANGWVKNPDGAWVKPPKGWQPGGYFSQSSYAGHMPEGGELKTSEGKLMSPREAFLYGLHDQGGAWAYDHCVDEHGHELCKGLEKWQASGGQSNDMSWCASNILQNKPMSNLDYIPGKKYENRVREILTGLRDVPPREMELWRGLSSEEERKRFLSFHFKEGDECRIYGPKSFSKSHTVGTGYSVYGADYDEDPYSVLLHVEKSPVKALTNPFNKFGEQEVLTGGAFRVNSITNEKSYSGKAVKVYNITQIKVFDVPKSSKVS